MLAAFPSTSILDSTAPGRSLLTAASASAQRSLLGLGTLATQNGNIADYLTIASAATTYQPLDSDLTAIAALATTSFGRSVLTQADAAAVRTLIGAGTSSFNGAYSSLTGIPATFAPSAHNHSGSEITSGTVDPARLGTGTSITTKFLRGDSTWQTISGGGDALTTNTLAQFAATTSSQLAGVISDETGSGSLVFATSPTLVTPVLGTPTSGNLSNCTGYSYASLTGIPTTLAGYGITDAQPLDSDLTAIAALTTTSYGRSLLTQADAPTARTTLGLGTGDTPTFAGLTTTGIATVGDRLAFSTVAAQPRLRRLGNSLDVVSNDELAFSVFRAGELWLGSSLALVLDVSDVLAQRRGVNAQAFRVYNTFTDINNFERAKIAWESNVLRIGTEKFGTGSARALELQTDGVTRMTFAGNGTTTVNTGLNIQSASIAQIGNVSVAGAATQFIYDAGGGTSYTGTSGATSQFAARSGFSPSSGTMTFTGFLFTPLINQSGGASGITRGLFINPTLGNVADFRAIEVTVGKTILAASTTGATSLNIPSGSDPTSPNNGDIWQNSNLLKVRLNGRTQTLSYQITSGTAAPSGGSDGDIYLQYI